MRKVIVYNIHPMNPGHIMYKTETFSIPELRYYYHDPRLVFRWPTGEELTRSELYDIIYGGRKNRNGKRKQIFA